MSNVLTHARLLECLSYDKNSGCFTWKISKRGTRAGSQAGSVFLGRYIQIRIDQVSYYAHRLAVFYVTGTWPSADVDHINGNGLDNSYSNLRDVHHRVNQQNRHRPNKRTSGRSSNYLGVSWKKSHKKWGAYIGLPDGTMKFLGYYDDEYAAHLAYVEEKRKSHEGNML